MCCALRALSQRCSHTAHRTTTSFLHCTSDVSLSTLREVSTSSIHLNPDNMMCTSAYKTVSSTWIMIYLHLALTMRSAESRTTAFLQAHSSYLTVPFLLLSLLVITLFLRSRSRSSSRSAILNIRGPASSSLLFGITGELTHSKDPILLYAKWAKEYGSVYHVPTALGTHAVVVCDMKAAAHIFAKDTFVYVKTPGMRLIIEKLVGKGVIWVEGEAHRRYTCHCTLTTG